MKPERWQQIEQLYQFALNHEPSERAAFLKKACGDDEALRQEVESLLGYQGQVESFIERPALEASAKELLADRAQSLLGRQVGAYKILSLLGAGGMGEVYLAQDSRLSRTIALKILPGEVASDQDRMRRFIREARAASALKHPNVAHIYEIGESEGVHFIAMEYVEGETLASRISGRSVDTTDILEIGLQAADALDEAHSKGITHRDIKPANLMLTPRGQVKVLDFGLAKVTRPEGQAATTDLSTAVSTTSGTVMGTVQYMSPEQVLGKEVDHRTDIFSLGVVLYEMATGRLPFSGRNANETMDRILHEQPEAIARFNYKVPADLEQIVRKCLEKDREVRCQTASELRADLKRLKRDSSSGQAAREMRVGEQSTVTPAIPFASRWKRAAALGGVVILLALAMIFWRSPLPAPKILGSLQITRDGHRKGDFFWIKSLATDGSQIYFSEGGTLAQVSTAGGETVHIPTPFPYPEILDISPDRPELLVADQVGETLEWPLWILPVPGGSPYRLADITAHDAAWSPDGQQIVYANGSELYLAKSDGSDARRLVSVDGTPFFTRWSPDGSRLRFSVEQPKTSSHSLWEVAVDGTHLQPLLPGWKNPPQECCGRWTPDGKYFLFKSSEGERKDNIWAIREKGDFFHKLNSKPVQLTFGPLNFTEVLPSKDGRKLFVVGEQPRGELVHYDSRSRQLVPYLSGISAQWLSFSRDGEWVTYVIYPDATLWRSRVDGTQKLQLTFPPMSATEPTWSPNGKQIAFLAFLPSKPGQIYVVSAEGGSPQHLVSEERNQDSPSWSPDGNRLALGRLVPFYAGPGPVQIHIFDIKTRQMSTLPHSETLHSPQWSPDGRYIAANTVGGQKCMLFDSITKKWEELPKGQSLLGSSRNGKYLYFEAAGNDPALFRMHIDDRKSERLLSLKDIKDVRQAGIWGGWSGLAPDDSLLLLRDVGIQDIYALDWEAP